MTRIGSAWSPAGFHAAAGRLAARWPATMTTLSTHDTKRQEDVRARLAVLAEWPQDWAHQVGEWHGLARGSPTARRPRPPSGRRTHRVPDVADPGRRLADRAANGCAEYLRKAMREAKTRTSWTVPDPGYESAVLGLADAVLADPELTAASPASSPGSRPTPG